MSKHAATQMLSLQFTFVIPYRSMRLFEPAPVSCASVLLGSVALSQDHAAPGCACANGHPVSAPLFWLAAALEWMHTPRMQVAEMLTPASFKSNIKALAADTWSCMCMCVRAGLLGGAVYVNAFTLISRQVDPLRREFSLAAASLGDSLGIAFADIAGILIQGCLYKVNTIPGASFSC